MGGSEATLAHARHTHTQTHTTPHLSALPSKHLLARYTRVSSDCPGVCPVSRRGLCGREAQPAYASECDECARCARRCSASMSMSPAVAAHICLAPAPTRTRLGHIAGRASRNRVKRVRWSTSERSGRSGCQQCKWVLSSQPVGVQN